MKARVIVMVSGLSVLGLAAYAIVQMDNTHNLSIFAVVLSLVPLYFLYAVLVLGKFSGARKIELTKEERLQMMALGKKSVKETRPMKRVANDHGKVLDFPKDKQKKSDKENK